jgi:hypothetical protein
VSKKERKKERKKKGIKERRKKERINNQETNLETGGFRNLAHNTFSERCEKCSKFYTSIS